MSPSRNRTSRSNPGRSSAGSQHPMQPQNIDKRSKRPARRSRRSDPTPQIPGVDITAPRTQQVVPDGHGKHEWAVTANSIPRLPGGPHDEPFSPVSMQDGGCNPLPNIADPAIIPMATQFRGAHSVNISGNTRFTNIGMNTGNLTTVNNYGGIHGLEKLENSVSFAALHDSAEQDPDRRCHPGTRKTVLGRLQDWIGNPNPTDRIFWLHGPAGAGKSAIAQTIAHECREQGVAATFFFYRSDAERNDGNRLFTTIAWQLAFSIPAIKDFIVHGLNKTPHLPTKGVEAQYEQLVVHPFHAMNHIATQMLHLAPVVIIDGVDECSNEQLQRRFLTVIGNTVGDSRVPLRFLICSRPEALIEETLDQFKDITLRIDLATLDDSNRDIEKYLVDQSSVIASKHGLDPSWPGQEIIQEIVFKSSGNFILASTLIRFISDEDYSPESQLAIIRNLKPPGTMSPFALLDELYVEILKRVPDQDFLKTFLALLVGRSSVKLDDLHEDDATLMNVSEKELHIKLRRMRSLLKLEPFIDVYHKSFFDFLQDPARSGQYHVSEHGGLKRYLELIVDLIVRHVPMAIEQPKCHEACHSSPRFKSIVEEYPPKIVLPVEDWQETLKPLLDLQDKLFRTSMPHLCYVTQTMRELLLHLVILQGKSQPIADARALESPVDEEVTGWSSSLMTEDRQNIPEKGLDSCLSALLSYLEEMNPVLTIDVVMIDLMSSLLAFDCAETVTRVQSVSDAQKLINFIDLLTNSESFPSQCGPDVLDVAPKAAHLAIAIFARVPLLPWSLFLKKPSGHHLEIPGSRLESVCQIAFICRILDHNYIAPILRMDFKSNQLKLVGSNKNEQSVDLWLKRSNPNFITRIRVMLEVARAIRYIHSMDVALYSDCIHSRSFFLDSDLRAKFEFMGLFAWWRREASTYGHEDSDFLAECIYDSNISAFADLFQEVCFDSHGKKLSSRVAKDATRLIKRCHAEGSKGRATMEDVVKEMETWKLT